MRAIISGGCPFIKIISIQVHGRGGEHGGDPHAGWPAAGHGQPRGGGSPTGTSHSCRRCCILMSDWSHACAACAYYCMIGLCAALHWCLIGHILVSAYVWLDTWLCVPMYDWSCVAVHWCLIGHMFVCAEVWLDLCLCVLMYCWSDACVLISDWPCADVYWCLIDQMLVCVNVWLVMCCCVLMSDWTHACVC